MKRAKRREGIWLALEQIVDSQRAYKVLRRSHFTQYWFVRPSANWHPKAGQLEMLTSWLTR